MIVVDASVLVTGLADDGLGGDQVRARLRHEHLVAPHLLDLEVISAWRRLAASGALDERRAALARHDLASLRIDRIAHSPLLERCWELRGSLSVYDAAYVAIAELLEVPLLTADRRLAAASGMRCEVEVLG